MNPVKMDSSISVLPGQCFDTDSSDCTTSVILMNVVNRYLPKECRLMGKLTLFPCAQFQVFKAALNLNHPFQFTESSGKFILLKSWAKFRFIVQAISTCPKPSGFYNGRSPYI